MQALLHFKTSQPFSSKSWILEVSNRRLHLLGPSLPLSCRKLETHFSWSLDPFCWCYREKKIQTNLEQFCLSQEDLLTLRVGKPMSVSTFHSPPPFIFFLFFASHMGCRRKEEKKQKRKRKSNQYYLWRCHIDPVCGPLSPVSAFWKSRMFILLYQCNCWGQRAHSLSSV